MNFQYIPTFTPLRVLVVNPLVPASQLTITKMLSGIVFGMNQLIDLIMLVYSNEMYLANEYAQELTSCAFPCFNSVRATSDLPNIADADIFCFMTNFENPNSFNVAKMDSDEQFDTLYLIIKIAINLGKPLPVEEATPKKVKKTAYLPQQITKPMIVGDGLLVIDILMSLAKTLSPDIFFCGTPIRSLSQTVLSDHLKVECTKINKAYVWAADDQVFHVEIERPYLLYDKDASRNSSCDWDAVGKEVLESLSLDHIQFNASWMKREFIEKIFSFTSTNPYGSIYKSAEFSETLRAIWKPNQCKGEEYTYTSLGVISDGSLGTIKGLPYVLPLVITKDSWWVDTNFEESSHLRSEIKTMNKVAKANHDKLIPYCKKFLVQNVINKAFVPHSFESSESESTDFTPAEPSTRVSTTFD